jgi:hypothetical protein
MLAAVQQDGRAFRDASEGLRGDRQMVLAGVQQNGRALRDASEELRGWCWLLCIGMGLRLHMHGRG